MNKKERFNQAYNYAYDKGLIHSQKDLSEKMQTTESNVSRALKGVPSVLTDRFISRFCHVFPIFSVEWLMYGEESSEMLKEKENNNGEQDIISLAAQLIKQNEELRALLVEEIKRTTQLRQELFNAISELRLSIAIPFESATAKYMAESPETSEPSAQKPSKPYQKISKKSV